MLHLEFIHFFLSAGSKQLVDYGRKIAEQDRLLSEYSRKLIQLEQKISNSESDPVDTSETPPPSGRKRKADGKSISFVRNVKGGNICNHLCLNDFFFPKMTTTMAIIRLARKRGA